MIRTPSLVLAGVLSLLAAACGGSGKPAGDPASAAAQPTGATATDPAAPSASPTAGAAAGGAGAGGASSSTAASSSTGASTAGTSTDPAADAGASGGSSNATASTPAERPFAKTAAEATTLIDDVINARQKELAKCVADARARKKEPHGEVKLDVGIDQEGTLIGVKAPKGHKPDPALNNCVLAALKGAPFPRSNAGVITVHKSFTDKVVYPE